MLPTIIIGALALAILWPFIRLGYELIKLAGSLVLLVASCAIGAVAAGSVITEPVPADALGLPPTRGNEEGRHRAADGGEQRPRPHAPGIFLGALGPHRREPAKRKTEQAYILKGPCHEEQPD